MHRSYVNKSWLDKYLLNQEHPLPDEVVKRFLSVVRVKNDEKVVVFDGCGRELVGTIEKPNKFQLCQLINNEEPRPKVILLQGAIDLKKIEQTVMRCTEIGVADIVIFNAQFSNSFCYKKLLAKKDRLEFIAQDAARQSERAFIPKIYFCDDIKHAAEYSVDMGLGVFGDARESRHLSSLLIDNRLDKNIFIAVGPEGGLSSTEQRVLIEKSFISSLWAPFVLRSELAGFAALAIINAFLKRA